MESYIFYQLDVFTDEAFAGNPLAVFPEAGDLSDEQMQKIAREMNLSETVFVFPSDKALRRLRIFTPMRELPLAGHPVVGAWNLLAHTGVTPQLENGVITIEHELNVGVLPVAIEFRDEDPFRVTMTQAKFEAGAEIAAKSEIRKLARSLGLKVSDLKAGENLPVQVASTGIKALMIPVASLEALARCRINSSLLSEIYLERGAIGCYAFTFETKEDDSMIHARFFAPDDLIAEDPATGSAAGALSGYLLHHGAVSGERAGVRKGEDENSYRFTIEQGDFINRASRIFAEVAGEKGNVEKVRIGGSSVVVAQGEIFL